MSEYSYIGFMLNVIQKIRRASSFVKLVKDPNRLDEVFELADRAELRPSLERLALEFAKHPKGARALQACRRLPRFDLQELAKLPHGSLGQAFAEHMLSRGLRPEAIPTLGAPDAPDFIRAHLYETHDIWHVVTGFDTDIAGELGLQGFYMAQVQGPLPPILLAVGMLNSAFYAIDELPNRMRKVVVGWQMGLRAEPLFGTDWDLLWNQPLTEIRRLHGIDPRGAANEFARSSDGPQRTSRPTTGTSIEISQQVSSPSGAAGNASSSYGHAPPKIASHSATQRQ